MRIKLLLGATAALLLAGCSATNTLTSAGSQVQITDTQPGSECQLLGTVTGVQNNWLSGSRTESQSLRGAANDLRNKAAAMGGNVIFNVGTGAGSIVDSFAPLDSKMSGQVYQCQ